MQSDFMLLYRVAHKENGTDTVDFSELCSDQQFFFHLAG